MRLFGWERETRKIACGCQIDPNTPENVSAYTLAADPNCSICGGAGVYTEHYWSKLIASIPKDEHGRLQLDQAYAPDGSPHPL